MRRSQMGMWHFVYLAHYSTIRYKYPYQRHFPILKSQSEDDHFGDAYQYLCFLAGKNKRFHVTFEHNPTLVKIVELHNCYDEVSELLTSTK